MSAASEFSLPDPMEVELAKTIGPALSELQQMQKGHELKLVFRKGSEEVELAFPIRAFHLLVKIMEQMALGNSVTLIPLHAQLTTQEAADLLNVSRPFVIKLLNERKIPYIKVGTHRRVEFKDLMAFKEKMAAESEKARDELAQLGQELDMDD